MEIRKKFGNEPGTRLEVDLAGDAVLLRVAKCGKVSSVAEGYGMLEYFGPRLQSRSSTSSSP
jgi:bifunctional DNA-binding transcriptional regulator/antitoxin component of YhaV-PrlF toxin-antitoxin module